MIESAAWFAIGAGVALLGVVEASILEERRSSRRRAGGPIAETVKVGVAAWRCRCGCGAAGVSIEFPAGSIPVTDADEAREFVNGLETACDEAWDDFDRRWG